MGRKFQDSGCISRCLFSARKFFFVKFLVLINKVANKDSTTILWKIVAESRADIIFLFDCYTEISHAGREVVKLCSRFCDPESCVR
jgi:hypothetical protein